MIQAMMQAERDYQCAIRGHIIQWGSASTNEVCPPGSYVCSRCNRDVYPQLEVKP